MYKLRPGVVQLEESAETHMIHAYVHLQEGAIMEGDNRINLAINKALEMCASCSLSLSNTSVLEWPVLGGNSTLFKEPAFLAATVGVL